MTQKTLNLSRWFWILLLLGAGLSHFLATDFLILQMPPYFPRPKELIFVSGIIEIVFALMLWQKLFFKWVWLGIVLMCISYLPLHWHVYDNADALALTNGSMAIPKWVALIRLPIQFAMIGWALMLFLNKKGLVRIV